MIQLHLLFISGVEIGFILVVILLVFGADKIPEIARGLGKGLRQVKDATNDIKSEISKSADKLQNITSEQLTNLVFGFHFRSVPQEAGASFRPWDWGARSSYTGQGAACLRVLAFRAFPVGSGPLSSPPKQILDNLGDASLPNNRYS